MRVARILFVDGLLMLSAILVVGATAWSATPPSQRGKADLVLNWKPEPQFGGFYRAEAAGYLKGEGADIRVKPGGAGTPVVQMVASGAALFGIASADEVVISQSRGSDVVALFAVYQTNPQAIMAHASRGFSKLGDLFAASGTLAMQQGLAYAQYLQRKYPKAKVKVVPYSGGISSFLADDNFAQQCFFTSEPLAAKRVGKATSVFLVADEGYNPYTTVLIARRETVASKNGLVQAVVRAVRKGWDDYLLDPTATNAMMQKLNPSMDAETFRLSAEVQKPLIKTSQPLGSMSEERWKTLAGQLVDLGVIKSAPKASNLFVNY